MPYECTCTWTVLACSVESIDGLSLCDGPHGLLVQALDDADNLERAVLRLPRCKRLWQLSEQLTGIMLVRVRVSGKFAQYVNVIILPDDCQHIVGSRQRQRPPAGHSPHLIQSTTLADTRSVSVCMT